MEKVGTIPEVKEVDNLDFKAAPSKTYKVLTGCGNIYISATFNDNHLHKIKMERTNKLHCSPTLLGSLFRSITFQSRRDIKQSIKDLKGSQEDACDKFNITVKAQMRGGDLAAYSCSDAIARVLEKILKENGDAVSQ